VGHLTAFVIFQVTLIFMAVLVTVAVLSRNAFWSAVFGVWLGLGFGFMLASLLDEEHPK
jgi:positive regulator of sigma E activity